MKKAVIYARYSSHNQRDESIEGQLRECHDYAVQNDYIVLEEYCDRALTGKTDNRAGFQKMIKDAKNNKFNYVLVYKLDRFARNRYDSAHYKSILRKNGVKVTSATETISDSAEGVLLESLLEGMAEYYSADLAEKVVAMDVDAMLEVIERTNIFEDLAEYGSGFEISFINFKKQYPLKQIQYQAPASIVAPIIANKAILICYPPLSAVCVCSTVFAVL